MKYIYSSSLDYSAVSRIDWESNAAEVAMNDHGSNVNTKRPRA